MPSIYNKKQVYILEPRLETGKCLNVFAVSTATNTICPF